jgi:hypothetical protein
MSDRIVFSSLLGPRARPLIDGLFTGSESRYGNPIDPKGAAARSRSGRNEGRSS